jgi:hypothetical protein
MYESAAYYKLQLDLESLENFNSLKKEIEAAQWRSNDGCKPPVDNEGKTSRGGPAAN